MTWSPYPHLVQRPSVLAHETLSALTDHDERNKVIDMINCFETLEAIADEVEVKINAHDKAVDQFKEQIEDLQADIQHQADEHSIDLDDYRNAAATSEKVVQVIERAFSEIGLTLPADPSDWHHETIMEAFAARMAELMDQDQ